MSFHVAEEQDRIDEFSLMVECACSMIGGAKIILASSGTEENGQKKYPILPVLVCSAFAIEIQLKAILRKLGITLPNGDLHDLELLFNTLPISIRETLLKHQAAYTFVAADSASALLHEHKDTFKKWRYPYESDELSARPSFLFGFAKSINDYIKSNYSVERSMQGWLGALDEG